MCEVRPQNVLLMYYHLLAAHNILSYCLFSSFRCKDGTEFGTGFGSLQCKTGCGLLSSCDPLKEDADWVCSGCKKKVPGKECVGKFDELDKKLKTLSKEAAESKESIMDFEKV